MDSKSKCHNHFSAYSTIRDIISEWKANSSKIKGGETVKQLGHSVNDKYRISKYDKDKVDINELGLGITFLLTPEYDEIIRVKKKARVVYWSGINSSPEIGIIQCLKLVGEKMCAIVHFPQLLDPIEKVFPHHQIPNELDWNEFELGMRHKLKRFNSIIFRLKDFFDEKVHIFLTETNEELRASYKARTKGKKIVIVENDAEGNCVLPPIEMNVNAIGRFVSEGYLGMLGGKNSGHLDALMASLFAFNSKFDFILQKRQSFFAHDEVPGLNQKDLLAFQIREVLRCCIVNPLRANLYCPSQNTNDLRILLSRLNSHVLDGQMGIEEFMLLLCETLDLDNFINYTSGTGTFLHHTIVDNMDLANATPSRTVTTQRLLELSMRHQKLTFDEKPNPGLILVSPRNNGKLEHVDHIIPSLHLDVTDLLQEPRTCIVCGNEAKYECDECFDHIENSGIKSTSFCGDCIWMFHKRNERRSHHATIRVANNTRTDERSTFDLTAIICLRESHFVAYVKSGPSLQSPWVLFNSDISKSATAGVLNHFGEYISLLQTTEDLDSYWPSIEDHPDVKRLFNDGYMYIYC